MTRKQALVVGPRDDVATFLASDDHVARMSAIRVRRPAVMAVQLPSRYTTPLLEAVTHQWPTLHALVRTPADTGSERWDTVHRGTTTELTIPDDVAVSLTVTAQDRLYLASLGRRAATMGRGALVGAIVDDLLFTPRALARPATVVIDADRGVARPDSGWVRTWWHEHLTFDGDVITGTTAGLGRMVRDRANPRDDVVPGGWQEWAWDAMAAYARESGASVGELSQAMLCASAATGLPTFDHTQELARLATDPLEVLAAARSLAGHFLDCDDLVATLLGIFAT